MVGSLYTVLTFICIAQLVFTVNAKEDCDEDCDCAFDKEHKYDEKIQHFEARSQIINTTAQLDEYNCVDENGNNVDWYIVYIIPNTTAPSLSNRYVYLTSRSASRSFTLSSRSIGDANSIFGSTLTTFLNNNPGWSNYYVYNDKYPNSTCVPKGNAHAKGVVVFGRTKGFWLWHTVPRLVPLPGQSYNYPNTGYGQVAACFSFNTATMRTSIENHLGGINAFCMSESNPNGNGSCVPEIANRAIVNFNLVNSNGVFTNVVYTKSRALNLDIYSGIANIISQNLVVQSWRPNIVNDGSVSNANITTLRYTGGTFNWGKGSDHSKVVVDNSATQDTIFCVGDMNRATSQMLRGGGLMCFPRNTGPTGIEYKY